jgi:hypothetical protein
MTDPWRMRDPAENTKPKKEPTNTYQLMDNCYYVTTAKLLGITTKELFDRTEEMQIGGGAKVSEIEELLKATGVSYGGPLERKTLHEIAELAYDASHGLDKSFGLCFVRTDQTGHAVVMKWDAADGEARYVDYQVNSKGADAKDDVAGGVTFVLFWF